MNEQDTHNPMDQALWRRVRPTDDPPRKAIDANDLAAYLEGRAEQAVVERVEENMRLDPVFLEEVMELRGILNEALAEPLPGMQARAVALVKEVPREHGKSTMELDPIHAVIQHTHASLTTAMRWWIGLRWSASVAIVSLACFAGFAVGQGWADETREPPIADRIPSPSVLPDLAHGPSDPMMSLTVKSDGSSSADTGRGGVR